MRFYYNTDIALMAGGTMRGDQIYPAGILRLGDIISCFPFEDPCVVIRTSGSAIFSALENSVSKLPALEGRFCQVSGVQFAYDPNGPEGKRVRWVNIGGNKLELEKRYTIATRGYMARGKDGFESLNVRNSDVEEIINEEHGILLSMMIRQYFLSLKIVSRWKRGICITDLFTGLKKEQTNCGALSATNGNNKAIAETDESSEEEDEVVDVECSSPVKERLTPDEEMRLFELKQRVAKKWEILAKVGRNIRKNGDANVGVDWCRSVRPEVEGRINVVNS